LPSTGSVPVTFDAPGTPGEHMLTLRVAQNPYRLADTSRTFAVTAVPVDAPSPTPAVPGDATSAAPVVEATAGAGTVPGERSEVLATGSTTSTGFLAATGTQAVGIG